MTLKPKRSAWGAARALFGGGSTTRKDEPSTVFVDTSGGQIPVRLRRTPRARRVSLRVSATAREVVLTLPARVPLGSALAFLDRHADWVGERCARWAAPEPLVEGGLVPLRDTPHRIERADGRGRPEIQAPLEPGGTPTVRVFAAPERVGARVMDCLKAEARRDLLAAVGRHCAAIGRKAPGVGLRDPKGRWGSCSAKGALNFSWRLIMAPPYVLDYVAAHEVAHLREMNHGARFWTLVEELDPDYRLAEAWLKRHGPELHRYGPCA